MINTYDQITCTSKRNLPTSDQNWQGRTKFLLQNWQAKMVRWTNLAMTSPTAGIHYSLWSCKLSSPSWTSSSIVELLKDEAVPSACNQVSWQNKMMMLCSMVCLVTSIVCELLQSCQLSWCAVSLTALVLVPHSHDHMRKHRLLVFVIPSWPCSRLQGSCKLG